MASQSKLPASEEFITVHINRRTLRAFSTKVRTLAIVVGWLLSVVASCLAIGAYLGFVG